MRDSTVSDLALKIFSLSINRASLVYSQVTIYPFHHMRRVITRQTNLRYPFHQQEHWKICTFVYQVELWTYSGQNNENSTNKYYSTLAFILSPSRTLISVSRLTTPQFDHLHSWLSCKREIGYVNLFVQRVWRSYYGLEYNCHSYCHNYCSLSSSEEAHYLWHMVTCPLHYRSSIMTLLFAALTSLALPYCLNASSLFRQYLQN